MKTISPTQSYALQKIPLRVNVSWIFLGRGFYAATQWGILVVLAKLGNPEAVGRFGLALAVTAPVFALLNLNLRALLATDVNNKHNFGTYLGLRLVTVTIALLMISSIIFVTQYSLEVSLVILGIGIAKSIESVSDVLFGLIQKHEKMIYIAQSDMLKGILSLGCVGIIYYMVNSLVLAILGLVIIWTGMMALFDVRNAVRFLPEKRLKPNFHLVTLGELTWLAVPLGISTILVSLSTNIPRYLIERYHAEAILGYFTAMVYLIAAGDIIFMALRYASIPRLSKYYETNRPAFVRLLLKLTGLGTALGLISVLVVLLFGQELLTFFYSADYAQYANILVWLMIVGTVRYVFGFVFSALIAMRLLHAQTVILAISTCIGLVVAWFFIPSYGQMGAVWSMLIMACLNLLLGSGTIISKLGFK